VTSDPQNGATVESPPDRVSVTFSEPLDSTSTLKVFDQCGRAVDAGDDQVLGSRIDVGISATPSGHYTAVYVAKGFAGATGETKGSFSFHVTSGTPCDGGHGDHDGHGPGGDGGHGDGHGEGNGGDHDGHDDGNGGDHDGHDGGGDHTGTGAEHGSDAHGPDDHGSNGHRGDGHGGGDHRGKGHGGGHGDGRDGDRSSGGDGGPAELASGRGGPGLAPTSTSVVIALALSVAMGAVGGWVLRVSAGS
jgi:methionine-rich copper-binding protein CopC